MFNIIVEDAKAGDARAIAQVIEEYGTYLYGADQVLGEDVSVEKLREARSFMSDSMAEVSLGFEISMIEARDQINAIQQLPEWVGLGESFKDGVWYRGLTRNVANPLVNDVAPDYAVFLTRNPLQAASYAGLDGVVAEISISGELKIGNIDMISSCERFSPTKFDKAARGCGNNSVVAAFDVLDTGFYRDDIIGALDGTDISRFVTKATVNVAVSPRSELLGLNRVVKVSELLSELKNSGFEMKEDLNPAAVAVSEPTKLKI